MNPTSKPFLCLLALCLVGTLPLEVPAAAPPPVALKDFARHAEFESAKISPTGDYLAVAMLVEGRTALGIIDLKNNKVSGQLRFPKGNEVADYYWVGPKRVVASVAKSFGPLDQPALTGELYGIDADGGHRTYLFGYRGGDHMNSGPTGVKSEYASAFLIDALPHQPDGALVVVIPWRGRDVRDPLIERLDVLSGQRQRVTVVPGYAPIDAATDRDGRVRFAYSSDENNGVHLYAKAETGTGWREIQHPGGMPESIVLHGATADGASVFLTTNAPGGPDCLREYRFDTGALKERRCSEKGAVGRPVFSFDDDALIGIEQEAGKPEFEPIDAKHPDTVLLRALSQAFGGQRVRVTSHTLDAKRLVVLVDSDRNPGDYYLVDRQTRKADYLLSRRAWIDPAAMAPAAAMSYKTRDGATVHGYLTARGGLATRKAPLVIMPHGGPHGVRDNWEWDPWAQALASRNYAVLQVNYRGSGGYGEAHERVGYRKWGTLMQDDLTDAVRWAIDQGIADPDRICIMGASYGGYAALMSPVREPDLYKCAIAFAGVYDLESQSEDSDTADSRWGRNRLEQILGDDDQMHDNSPVTYIEKLKVPVLVAHGTADKRVPFSQAKLLRKALKKHGKAYEWAEYDDEWHGFYIEANHEDFLKKSLAFLDRHIGTAPAAANSAAQNQ